MSTDEKPFGKSAEKFRLAHLASAIKEVRKRGGKWSTTADAIEWAQAEIERLTTENAALRECYTRLVEVEECCYAVAIEGRCTHDASCPVGRYEALAP